MNSPHPHLIISLIADDLLHTRLCEEVAALGLRPGQYTQHLGDTIISLMGFEGEQGDVIFHYYLDLRSEAILTSSCNQNELKHHARIIYNTLLPAGTLPATNTSL